MKLNPRFSSLATTTICAFTFLFAATTVPAVAARTQSVVGTLETENGATISVNGKTVGNGAQLKVGDVIVTTGESVKVAIGSGLEYVIEAGSQVRITRSHDGKVSFQIITGDVHTVGGNSGGDDYVGLPYIGAFGFGNLQSGFPSTGGGSSSTAGKVPVVNQKGVVIGYAVTDAFGRVVAFTDVNGNVLAYTPPNGTPTSKVFGKGATLL
jgi:hypothetical protein